jgi:hypothetical protein
LVPVGSCGASSAALGAVWRRRSLVKSALPGADGGAVPFSPEVAVALQGTLDTFSLADVLRLLTSTGKSGRLSVTGSRASGSICVDGGAVVASEADGVRPEDGPVAVIFELVRCRDGAFRFDPDAILPAGADRHDLEPLLDEAETLLHEWADIESVIPSLDATVRLAPALPTDQVVIDATLWRTIAGIGGGMSVRRLADVLEIGDVAACRAVKELVEAGVVVVGAAEAVPAWTAVDDRMVDQASIDADLPSWAARGLDDEPADVGGSRIPADALGGERGEGDLPQEALDHLAGQLAHLSPKAAEAVAAAARAVTDEEREAALADLGDDEPINRGLLMRFLSSVRS